MPEFKYQKPFPLPQDKTQYRLLTKDHVKTQPLGDKEMLIVDPEGLRMLARQALHDVSFFLRTKHNEKVAKILTDPEASENDRFVARTMLENSVIAAQEKLPTCQDTGTATVVAKKGQYVFTGCNDEEELSYGIFKTYAEDNLRYSQSIPLSMYEEKNSGTNLPAQIDIYSTPGHEYEFLFLAKGGGSANKTQVYQQTKAVLNPKSLEAFLIEKIRGLGTSACPPYHLAIVVGGTSAETCLKIVKLASTGYLDELPKTGNDGGQAFRDIELEERLQKAAFATGIGAQFGGKYFVHDVRVVRLPRHGASCPIGIGLSCSADRNIKAKINCDGIWLEELDRNPERWLKDAVVPGKAEAAPSVKIDLNQPMQEVLAVLSRYPVKTRLELSGKMIVARDIAHAKLKERLDRGEGLPDYFKKHAVYYAGPAKTPLGMPSGSFGPTTAGRMDPYVDLFQAQGGSMIMIAKGNRSKTVTEACKKHRGFYLGSIGGPAAILAQNNIKSVKVLDYPELGMEAIWEIEVENFPAFILVDDKGNDFFE